MEQKRSTSLRLSNQPQKLLARDLSESLGKLPPQAVDLEEAVLGALMLEQPAFKQVSEYLKADHFYTEIHKEIYNAMLALRSENAPVDMRTVITKLRETGKIELVGGAYYIAELTSKVSSAASVDYHARVIMEMAMKRRMIEIASEIHHQAYEDDSDPFELMDRLEQEFQFFKKNTVGENLEQKIKNLWQSILITEEPPEEPPLITLNGTPIVIPCNHTLIVGKKKTRKTLFIAWIISEHLKSNPANASKVLLFDTEQGKSHVWKLRKKIHQLTGLWVPIFYLRGQKPSDRREIITQTVKFWTSKVSLIVVDGIRDCMANINDPVESTDVIVWLEKMTLDFNIGVINVLHLNKTDNNARGHIGTELLNKAVCTIEMELDDKTNCTIVKCESARDKPFETFAFTHDTNELPVIVGTPMAGKVISPDDKKNRLNVIFEDGPLNYKELVEAVKIEFELSINKAQALIARCVREGILMKSGKPRDPSAVYKLISSNGVHPTNPLAAQTHIELRPAILSDVPSKNVDDLPF